MLPLRAFALPAIVAFPSVIGALIVVAFKSSSIAIRARDCVDISPARSIYTIVHKHEDSGYGAGFSEFV